MSVSDRESVCVQQSWGTCCICEKGDRLQIASLLRMTECTITPSSYSQSLHVCVRVWEEGIRVCNVTRLTVVLDSLWP